MADLFDMKVGGAGWHVTSHLIALVALFVACFAITGYISFRDNSIDRDALKYGPDEEGVLDLQGGVYTYRKVVNVPAATTDDGDGDALVQIPLDLPAGVSIISGTLMALSAIVGDAAGTIDLVFGPTNGVARGAALAGTTDYIAHATALNGGAVQGVSAVSNTGVAAFTATQYFYLAMETAETRITTGGDFLVELSFIGAAPLRAD